MTIEDEKTFNVLHVCETSKGGVGTFLSLFSSFDRRKTRSVFVAPRQHRNHLAPEASVETFDRPKRGLRAIINMIKAGDQTVRSMVPDIIICHSTFSLAMVAWSRLVFRNISVIYIPHSIAAYRYANGSWKQRAASLVEGLALRMPSLIVYVSEAERSLASHLGYPGRNVVIENALFDAPPHTRDDLFQKYQRDDRTILLFVGRLDRQKGFDILVEAMRTVSDERPDLLVYVVGASVCKDLEVGELPPNIILHGWVDYAQIDSWYRSSDALLVPSRWEGLPFVIIETLRNGTPALVSDSAGLPDLIVEDVTGKVFTPDPKALAELLRVLDRNKLREMRNDCRQSYEDRFHGNRLEREFIDLVKSLSSEDFVEEVGTCRA